MAGDGWGASSRAQHGGNGYAVPTALTPRLLIHSRVRPLTCGGMFQGGSVGAADPPTNDNNPRRHEGDGG